MEKETRPVFGKSVESTLYLTNTHVELKELR